MSSTIELTLNGLFVIYVSPDDKECTVGFLREAPPNHGFKISVLKGNAAGGFTLLTEIEQPDIAEQLMVDVKNTSTTGIARRVNGVNATIDRKSGASPSPAGNAKSFLWVVDFERDIYQKPVGNKLEGFISLLTVNNGELLTREISGNKLLTRLGHTGSFDEFGFVAVRSGIDIVLDQPESTAVFTNGGTTVFEADSKSSFKVIFDRGIPPTHAHAAGNDADAYYTAIGQLIPEREKKFFSSTPPAGHGPLPPVTPDASCFNGGGGAGP